MQIPAIIDRQLCAFLFFFMLLPLLGAQEAHIIFSSGGAFTISSGGIRAEYQGGSTNTSAIVLHKDDIIQTGPNSIVEMQIEPGGTKIKIAENTSLVCTGPGLEPLSMSYMFLYGRIRISAAQTWQGGGGNAIHIKTSHEETIFRQGDIGMDYIINAERLQITQGVPSLTVYNFHGITELMPASLQSSQGLASSMVMHEYESLSVEIANSLSYIERKPLEEGIVNYWNRHNISGNFPLLTLRPAAMQPVPEQATQAAGRIEYVYPPAIIEHIYPDNPFHRKLFRIKNFLISSGMILAVGGIGMQIAGSYGIAELDDHTNTLICNLGYIPIVLGLIFNGAALVISPENMVANASN